MSEHIMSSKFYYTIWIALLCLTVITAAVSFVDLGPLNTVVALVIATIKALLVVLFFMHVKQSSAMTKLFVVAGFFWMAILFAFTLGDYFSRNWLPRGKWW